VTGLRFRHCIFLALATIAACGNAFAQARQQQPAGPYVIELAVAPKPHVTETAMVFTVTTKDGKPVDTAKAKGHADFSSGGLKGRATLHPDGANRMKGYGLMSAKPDLRIEVTISFSGEPTFHVTFTPLR